MGALKWIRAVVAMAAFISAGYVTACAGDGDKGAGEERVGEAEQAFGGVGEGCLYSPPLGYYCNSGLTCCTTGIVTCRDLNNDYNNCGSCGHSCAGSQWCRGGTCCGVNKGLVHLGDCDHNGTCEKALNTNTDCGYCGRTCSGGQNCVNYNCQCPSGQTDCSGTCTDLQNDDLNCGGCGNKCQGGKHCQSGTCQCPSGQTDCSGTCKNLQNDPSHCGSCTNACSVAHGTAGCSGGACTVVSCNSGYQNCDGNVSNGCEKNLNTDPSNCGGCGKVCGAGQTCTNGVCTCGSAGDCNNVGLAQPGCCNGVCTELNDPCNCGSCGAVITDAQYHATYPACQNRCCVQADGLAQTSCTFNPPCTDMPEDLYWCTN